MSPFGNGCVAEKVPAIRALEPWATWQVVQARLPTVSWRKANRASPDGSSPAVDAYLVWQELHQAVIWVLKATNPPVRLAGMPFGASAPVDGVEAVFQGTRTCQ